MKFSPKSEQKKIQVLEFLQLQGGTPLPPYTPVFLGDCILYSPYKGFCPQQLIEIRIN